MANVFSAHMVRETDMENNTANIFFPSVHHSPPSFYPYYSPEYPNSPVVHRGLNTPEQLKRLYKDPNLHNFCLNAITRIHYALYSSNITKKLFGNTPNPKDLLDCFMKYYAFFLKGTNALPFLQKEFQSQTGRHAILPIFSSDFDCTLLINPELGKSFSRIREILITELVYIMKSIVEDPYFWPIIRSVLQESELVIEPLGPGPIYVKDEAISLEDMNLSSELYRSPIIENARTMPGCPFQFVIHPNLHYRDSSLGFALFKIQTRTIPPLDILDISVPSTKYKDLRMDWTLHRGILVSLEPSVLFFVSDFISTYIDYRQGAKKNTRSNKSKKRTLFANTLRNTIIRPLLQRRILSRNSLPKSDNENIQALLNNL